MNHVNIVFPLGLSFVTVHNLLALSQTLLEYQTGPQKFGHWDTAFKGHSRSYQKSILGIGYTIDTLVYNAQLWYIVMTTLLNFLYGQLSFTLSPHTRPPGWYILDATTSLRCCVNYSTGWKPERTEFKLAACPRVRGSTAVTCRRADELQLLSQPRASTAFFAVQALSLNRRWRGFPVVVRDSRVWNTLLRYVAFRPFTSCLLQCLFAMLFMRCNALLHPYGPTSNIHVSAHAVEMSFSDIIAYFCFLACLFIITY